MSAPARIVMPQLGLTMTEGAVTRWIRQEGDQVRKGDPVAEVETDKAIIELEAPQDGVLLKILAAAGQAVAVGNAVAIVGEEGAEVGGLMEGDRLKPVPRGISPRARRLAEEHGIDWQALAGTGADGQITEQDVKAALGPQAKPPAPREGEPLSHHRQIIAGRLVESWRERPHIHLTVAIDMTAPVAFHRQHPETSYNDLLVKALATCLKEFPAVNASLIEGTVRRHPTANIGLAVAVDDDSLFVPVIREADKKSVAEIAETRKTLVEKAQARRLLPEEMSGGTFTLSNLGMYGVEHFTTIINPPETGILGVGAIEEQPCVREGQMVIRPLMRVTLGLDHRLVDGALGARFLQRLKNLMEQAP